GPDVGEATVAELPRRDHPLRRGRAVGAPKRDPVVVEDALRTIRCVIALQRPASANRLAEIAVIRPQQRMTETVHARVLPVPRRQPGARAYRGSAARADDLRPEVHHEPHADAGRAVGIVRTRHVALQVAERDVMVTRKLPPHLVHEHVTACFGWPPDGGDATVDARHLARSIARRFDVVAKKPDVAVVLRLDVVDLRALPEPGLAGRAARSPWHDQEGYEAGHDECEFHESRISAAGPNLPKRRGTNSKTLSRAANGIV